MAGTRRLSRLAESTSARLNLPPGPLVVGLSGGADSAALAFLCKRGGRGLRALHVNHGLAHSARMERAARTIADRLDEAFLQAVDLCHACAGRVADRRRKA